ncbi:hypothetical protein [uncultured Maricaulis sp.]|uniref:hypothetical protein n=1 Tax=uncultured Maricaulis sp. TaxID=174710 RepID=UPI0030DC88B8|tara:strand:- start:3917 stop:4522 length:606 start_codon:yes stop_codon:yes gene_type:complete
MTDRLNKADAGHRAPSGIDFLLLLVWIVSLIVAAQLFVRSQGLIWPIIAAAVGVLSLAAWLWRLERARRASVNLVDRAFGSFTLRNTLLVLGYVLSLVLAMSWLDSVTPPFWRIGLLALPSLFLAGWVWAFSAMIQSSDEMMRDLRIRAVALSAGTVLLLATIWGLFAQLLDAPDLPAYLLLPGFALGYGVALQIIGGADA